MEKDGARSEAPLHRESGATCCSERKRLLLLLFLCNICLYINRANMSVALVYMYSDKDGDKSSKSGLILSSFYWGYLVSQAPAGWLASRIGGKKVLMVAVGAWSIATLLVWPAYKAGVGFVVVSRMIVGMAEGANYPSQICLNALWVPVDERSRAWAFITSGESVGTIVALAGCPFLEHYFGWQSIFWVSGIMGMAWFLLFFAVASSAPETSKTISPCEREYILAHREQEMNTADNLAEGAAGAELDDSEMKMRLIAEEGGQTTSGKSAAVPWGRFFSSSAYWGLIVAHFAYNWGTYVLISWLPAYFNDMFSVGYKALGFFGMLPYIALGVISNFGGVVADALYLRGLKMVTVRKLMNTIGFVLPAICFLCLASLKKCDVGDNLWHSSCSDFYHAVVLLTLGVGLGGFAFSGYWINFIDISPRYSGHLLGASNSIATIPGIAGNLVTAAILSGHTNDWGLVFSLGAGINIFGAVIFIIFAKGEPQFE